MKSAICKYDLRKYIALNKAITNDPVIAGLLNRKTKMMQSSGITLKLDMITGTYFEFIDPKLQTLLNQIDEMIENRKNQIINFYETN